MRDALFALHTLVREGLRLLQIIDIGACIKHQINIFDSQEAAVFLLDEHLSKDIHVTGLTTNHHICCGLFWTDTKITQAIPERQQQSGKPVTR